MVSRRTNLNTVFPNRAPESGRATDRDKGYRLRGPNLSETSFRAVMEEWVDGRHRNTGRKGRNGRRTNRLEDLSLLEVHVLLKLRKHRRATTDRRLGLWVLSLRFRDDATQAKPAYRWSLNASHARRPDEGGDWGLDNVVDYHLRLQGPVLSASLGLARDHH